MTASPRSSVRVKSGAGSPSRGAKRASKSRAIGIVRVSRVGGRAGEAFVSPREQERRIEDACSREGLELVEVVEELDVSGGTPLEQRDGLRRAIEAIEAGEARVVVVGYFDRLFRSLAVQAEVLERVEAAGGSILTADVGQVTHASTGQWLSSTMLGAVSEYHRRVTAERTADAKRRAIEHGIPTFAKIPPGYRRRPDRRLEPDGKKADAIQKAFEMRANGSTVMEVRAYLKKRGIERSFHGTTSLLASRIYLGELKFGDLHNPAAHKPIVDAETFAAVQRMKSPRGRRAKSDRLLARLGVLRCGTCGTPMVVGSAHHGEYALYRCPPIGDCPRRVTISAELAETTIVEAVRKAIRGVKGSARAEKAAEKAEREFERADKALNAAVAAFDGLEDVEATRVKLQELRATREAALEQVTIARAASPAALVVTEADWDKLTLEERRALIRATVDQALVAPGRGDDRIAISLRR